MDLPHRAIELVPAEKIEDVADAERHQEKIGYCEIEIFLFFWFLTRGQLLGLDLTQALLRGFYWLGPVLFEGEANLEIGVFWSASLQDLKLEKLLDFCYQNFDILTSYVWRSCLYLTGDAGLIFGSFSFGFHECELF